MVTLGMVVSVFQWFPLGLWLAIRSRRKWRAGVIPRPTWPLFWGWLVFWTWPLWILGLIAYSSVHAGR